MITALRLHNFKCFADITLPMAPLTVLSGINSMGKSTVLQALLLLRQSAISGNHQLEGALLNGPLVALGTPRDVLYEDAETDPFVMPFVRPSTQKKLNAYIETSSVITLGITLDNEVMFKWIFAYQKDCEVLPLIAAVPGEMALATYPLFARGFAYLKAERIGPRTSFALADHELAKYNRIGNAGEYCAHLLARDERQPIALSGLAHHSEKELLELRAQTEAWLTEVGQNPRIHLQEHPKMDLVNMEFSFLRDGLPTMNYRPTNVGFGLTYALPVFVAVLSARVGDLIMIENPEAHLHPRGQAALGHFLALAAANGAQIIIETHSDHVLNGIRIAVKRKNIPPNSVALHFFDRAADAPCCIVKTPKIDSDGRLDHWPEGFFDEWEKGLAELL